MLQTTLFYFNTVLLLLSLCNPIKYATAIDKDGRSSISSIQSNPTTTSTLSYPIRNLESSLAAASAKSTVIAIQSPLRYTISSSLSNHKDSRTTTTTTCHNEDTNECCVVILTRRPRLSSLSDNEITSQLDNQGNTKDDDDDTDEHENDDEYFQSFTNQHSLFSNRLFHTLLPKHNNYDPHISSSSSNNNPTSKAIYLVTTGFASDIQHIVRCIANKVQEFIHLYGESSGGLSTHSIVKDIISPKMRDVTFHGGGGARPYGVEVLVIGKNSRINNTHHYHQSHNNNHRSSSFFVQPIELYTIDPTGNWMHWAGGGTCIGKHAVKVRTKLYKALSSSSIQDVRNSSSSGKDDLNHENLVMEYQQRKTKKISSDIWKPTLEIAMKCILETLKEDEGLSNYDDIKNSRYDAIVIFSSKNYARSIGCIKNKIVDEVYLKCLKEILNEPDTLPR